VSKITKKLEKIGKITIFARKQVLSTLKEMKFTANSIAN